MTQSHPNRVTDATHYVAVRHPAGARASHSHDRNDTTLLLERRIKALGDAAHQDGEVIDGARPLITYAAATPSRATVALGAGKIYANGLVHPVAAASLDVAAVGTVQIGLCIHERIVTYVEDPSLVGRVPGTTTYQQPGADRLEVTARWIARPGTETCDGKFIAVYTLLDGILVVKEPPSGPWVDLIERYDRERSGHYRVKGFGVTALGYDAAARTQVFSIAAGTVNVWGRKIDREFAQRLVVTENPTLLTVENEPHQAPAIVPAAGLRVFLNHGPVAEIVHVTVLKTATETVTHGAYAGAIDTLSHDSVAEIVSITQAARTYVAGTDFVLRADTIDWSPAGQEPAPGSSYSVTYRWYDTLDASEIVAHDASSVTITGATPNTTVQVRYKWALPRTDLIVIDRSGNIRLLKGTPVRYNPWPPAPPNDVLVLAKVENRWRGLPLVTNSRAEALHNNQLVAAVERIERAEVLIANLELHTNLVQRAPSAARGIFVDPLANDDLRDQGLAQTGAITGGKLQLAVAGGPVERVLAEAPFLLPFVEEFAIVQDLATGQRKINEYQVFAPLPGTLTLSPPLDFWVAAQTQWASDITRVFDMGARAGGGTEADTEETLLSVTDVSDHKLRVRDVSFALAGFGAGEILDALTFDGISITPVPPLVADGAGRISGQFTVPAGLPSGTKRVHARGRGATQAAALYTGSGVVSTRTLQRTFTTRIWRDLPPPTPPVTQPPPPPTDPEPPPNSPDREPPSNDGGGADPAAQSFSLANGRFVTGLDVKFRAIGDRANAVVAQLCETVNGYPGPRVFGEALLEMAAVAAGEWTTLRNRAPVYLAGGIRMCAKLLSDDAAHQIAVAELGGFDADKQQWVTAHPYIAGNYFDGSNNAAWLLHPKLALTYRLRVARFTAAERIVPAGHFDVVACTDLVVFAGVELPAAGTNVAVRITRANGVVYTLRPGQPLQLDQPITERITVDFVLTGTALASPVLYPVMQLFAGTIAGSATYISTAKPASPDGTPVAVAVIADVYAPGAATVTCEVGGPGAWQVAPLAAGVQVGDGYVERTWQITGITRADVRCRITITGSARDRAHIRGGVGGIRLIATPTPINVTA